MDQKLRSQSVLNREVLHVCVCVCVCTYVHIRMSCIALYSKYEKCKGVFTYYRHTVCTVHIHSATVCMYVRTCIHEHTVMHCISMYSGYLLIAAIRFQRIWWMSAFGGLTGY